MQRLKGKKKDGLRAVRLRILRDLKKYRLAVPAFLLYAALTTLLLGTVCPLSALTGFPCPGCGSTRALLLVLTGRWRAAFFYNPCIYLWMLLAAYAGWQRYVRGKRAAGGASRGGRDRGSHDPDLSVPAGGGNFPAARP